MLTKLNLYDVSSSFLNILNKLWDYYSINAKVK
jgi:hypothetical protein